MNRNRCKRCGRFTRAIEGDLCFDCLEKEQDEYYDALVETEICPVCGVVHGSNPYTGCR